MRRKERWIEACLEGRVVPGHGHRAKGLPKHAIEVDGARRGAHCVAHGSVDIRQDGARGYGVARGRQVRGPAHVATEDAHLSFILQVLVLAQINPAMDKLDHHTAGGSCSWRSLAASASEAHTATRLNNNL